MLNPEYLINGAHHTGYTAPAQGRKQVRDAFIHYSQKHRTPPGHKLEKKVIG